MVIICDGGGRDGGGGRISATGRRKRGARRRKRRRSDARERRGRTRERTVIATTSPRESPTIRARVPVITKSIDPDTVYHPRLSRSLACRRLYLPTYSASPTYLPTYKLVGGLLCSSLTRTRASARALGRCVSSWPADSSCRGSETASESHLDRGFGWSRSREPSKPVR